MTPGGGDPALLAALRRIGRERPTVRAGERCELCAAPILDEHQHLVDIESRSLLCSCRACYLLFTDHRARLRYRAVPDRYLGVRGFRFEQADWDDLQIPVGLAFCFRNSAQDRVVTFYPSPAGATESELPQGAWDRVLAANPALETLLPDVEALLVRRTEHPDGSATFECHLVPIDACYQLVGTMRLTWRGFDGGQEARAALASFFEQVAARSRPAPAPAEDA